MDDDQYSSMRLKLKGVMEFYVKTFFDYHRADMIEAISKWLDNRGESRDMELEIKQMDALIEKTTSEAYQKFDAAAFLILQTWTQGRDDLVTEFELRFVDAMEQILLKKNPANREVVEGIENIRSGKQPQIFVIDITKKKVDEDKLN